jgi:hypothetical protein
MDPGGIESIEHAKSGPGLSMPVLCTSRHANGRLDDHPVRHHGHGCRLDPGMPARNAVGASGMIDIDASGTQRPMIVDPGPEVGMSGHRARHVASIAMEMHEHGIRKHPSKAIAASQSNKNRR